MTNQNRAGSPARSARAPASPAGASADAKVEEAMAHRLAERILAKARETDLETMTQAEALAFAADISAKLRALGKARLRAEDYTFLSDLMTRLLAPRS